MTVLTKYLMLSLIRFYKYSISPLIGPVCRYHPTCSEYGIEAITRFGPFRGGYLTLKRIVTCHPWGGHGYDPVPES